MRTITAPDAFFVLERIDARSPAMPFFLKRDTGETPAAGFINELHDLFTLIVGRPEELRQQYGVKAMYAVLVVTPTRRRMHEIRGALRASRTAEQCDLFWFATDADLMAEPNIGKVSWLPTADGERRPIVWDASKWVATAYRD